MEYDSNRWGIFLSVVNKQVSSPKATTMKPNETFTEKSARTES